MKKNLILILAATIMTLAIGLIISGCGGDEGAKTEENATLPEDSADKMLLDTTMTEEEPPAQPPAEEKKVVAQKPQPKPEPKPEPKPKEPEIVRTTILPANTPMEVTLLTAMSTAENQIGDRFRAMVKGPAERGQELDLPAGTLLEGVIADLRDGTAEKEKASIKLKFTDFILPGEKAIPIEGYIITDDSSGVIVAGGQAGTIAKDAGIGAIAGGVLGAITGKKGDKNETAVKGAAAGAVIGGVAGALLHKDRVVFKENADTKIIIVSPVIQEKVKKVI